MENAIFEGVVSHSRNTSVKHHFNYPIFMVMLDLDHIDDLFSASKLWSKDRWNWASFRRSDYLDPEKGDLKQAVSEKVEQELGKTFHGQVYLLTHVRYLGICFNPVTFYFCVENNELRYILAEINNTPWNERHCYVLECDTTCTQDFSFKKTFHVSPFNPMDMHYDWRFTVAEDKINISMKCYNQGNCDFTAALAMRKQAATRKNLRNILITYPAVTVKVIAAIYWQALKLRIKGATFYSNPTSPQESHHGKLR